MNQFVSDIGNIFLARDGKRRRVSSYDRSGGNDDRLTIPAGEKRTIADISGCGIITHIWITVADRTSGKGQNEMRKIVLRMYWDGEETPSVEAPLGDFFGMGHGKCKNFVSVPLQMSPEDGRGLNSWWPMPFRRRARIEVINECEDLIFFYYYIDYEERASLPEDALYFHAVWHRECPTKGREESEFASHNDWCFSGKNTTGEGNYVILEAEGRGHYCGCNLNIHNLSDSALWNWPGEGDDMIFIDDEKTPSLHGTGTEDYVNMAWCPQQEYSAPYHGIILGGKDNWMGKITYYRYHIQDPVMFEKNIRVTIEHGHNNNRSDDWSSTAYWYQTEPHKPMPPLPPKEGRLPLADEAVIWGNREPEK